MWPAMKCQARPAIRATCSQVNHHRGHPSCVHFIELVLSPRHVSHVIVQARPSNSSGNGSIDRLNGVLGLVSFWLFLCISVHISTQFLVQK
jgi:hypothetical protein